MSRISGLCGNFVVVPFYIPTSNIWEFQFLYIFSITCYCSFSCSIEQFQLSKQVQIEVLWHLPHVCKLCVWPSGPAPERHSLIRSDQSSRSVVSHSATPWIAGWQASLSITNSRSSLRLMSIESVMPSNHLILCHPRLILTPIPPSIRVFQCVNALHEVAKVLEFQLQHHFFQRNPRADLIHWTPVQNKKCFFVVF